VAAGSNVAGDAAAAVAGRAGEAAGSAGDATDSGTLANGISSRPRDAAASSSTLDVALLADVSDDEAIADDG
jgi:hypothetical protein